MLIVLHSFFGKRFFSPEYVLAISPQNFWRYVWIRNRCDDEVQFRIIIWKKSPKKSLFCWCRSYHHLTKTRHTEGFTNVNNYIRLCLVGIAYLQHKKTDANNNMIFAYLYTIFLNEESISSHLLFDTMSTTFIPGKRRYRRKKGVKVMVHCQTYGGKVFDGIGSSA